MEISMRSKYIVLAVALSVSVVSIAWSADEPAPPATPAAQPAAPAAPAAQSASSSSSNEAAAKAPAKETATAAASKPSAADAAAEKQLLASGYKKKTLNGQTFFCRSEMPIGSRFEKEHCATAQDLQMQAQQAKDTMNGNKQSQGTRN
jgi:hypothetical protein